MNIRYKLISSYLFLIIFTVSVVSFLIVKKSENEVFKEVTEKSQRVAELINTTISVKNDLLIEKSNSDLNFAKDKINSLGDLYLNNNEKVTLGDYTLPTLYAGNQKLSEDNNFVDKIQESTGALSTIFLLSDNKLIRISTNLFDDKGRCVGTYIDSNSEIYQCIISKKSYSGRIVFNNKTYISTYSPLLDKNKNVIGAIALGNPALNYYLEKTIDDIKIGKTGYVYILDSKGTTIIHPHNVGIDVMKYDFIKQILSTKKGTTEYTYKGIHKLAYYTYFEPWDWYIVVTANYDDLRSSYLPILYTAICSGILIFILGSVIAYFMSNKLVKPINRLKAFMEQAGKGDLTVRSDIKSKDEIGVLSASFNTMVTENERLLQEAVQYDKLKTEFIANMSHELRTPLNIIFSTVQLFSLYLHKSEDSEIIEKLDHYTSIMKQNCYRLLRLVNNLIDITKIDCGFLELDLKNKNIVEVAENITLSTVEYIASMSRTIIFDTDVEEKIMAFDEEKLERILLNLISNATKFTEPGGKIDVKIYDKNDIVVISVKDDGIGIPKDNQSQIFERFKQVDSSLTRKHEGSGIGLAIVKSLVEMHGGHIYVSSTPQEGTEFTITLPVKLIPNQQQKDTERILNNETNIEKINIEFSDIYN